jgi:glycosyltransferase involved in cell wall biosynthesis
MSEPLLSLVVPVYNVAPYLRQCLDSLLAQTQSVDEIIVVDDGSTDECPAILAEYAGRASRTRQIRVIRQENGGLSAARNTGMALATGRYLAFVDSDDFVAPQMYERLLAMAQADDLDVALCNADYHFEGREPDRPIYDDEPASGVIAGPDWLRRRLQKKRLMHMVWMHLYRRDFLLHQGFAFIPRLVHEDVIWTTQVLVRAQRVRYDPTPLYRYRIVQRAFNEEQNRKRLEAIIASSQVNARTLIELADAAADAVDDTSVGSELRQLLRWQAVDGAFSIFHKIGKVRDRDWQNKRFREVAAGGLFPLLWRNAVSWSQKRRIARNYLRSLLAGAEKGAGTHA